MSTKSIISSKWYNVVTQYVVMTVAVAISAVAVLIFMAPFNIAPSGVSGIAVILNYLIDTPIGLVTFVLNIPIQYLAYKMLPGSWRVVARTFYVLTVYSVVIDVLGQHIPTDGVSENILLNAVFGGVLEGIAGGLIYRVGGTFGGTSTIAIILRRKFGMPMSATWLYTDLFVMGAAGVVFGWEAALYAMVALFITALASDYVLEGPSVIRTAVIVTSNPEDVSGAIMSELGRGVTGWEAQGMYTKQQKWVLYVSVSRSEIGDLRQIVMQVDEKAFMVIGQGHTAYGEGFKRPV
jgi:uncharacterized membrane-anchored protein YitT (DUF2179 family)